MSGQHQPEKTRKEKPEMGILKKNGTLMTTWEIAKCFDDSAPSGNAAGDGSHDPLDGRMRFKHNPAHACGTCAACGNEMVWNVPRMGPAGGFVHKATGKFECNSPIGGDMPHLPAQ